MARKPRFNLIGVPQHVIQRGNNREACFYAEEDYRFYLEEKRGQIYLISSQLHEIISTLNQKVVL